MGDGLDINIPFIWTIGISVRKKVSFTVDGKVFNPIFPLFSKGGLSLKINGPLTVFVGLFSCKTLIGLKWLELSLEEVVFEALPGHAFNGKINPRENFLAIDVAFQPFRGAISGDVNCDTFRAGK